MGPSAWVFPHEMQEVICSVTDMTRCLKPFVMYEYAVEAGWMERSRYFGFSTDLCMAHLVACSNYHFDHFMGKALSIFEPMINMASYEIMEPKLREDGRTNVEVKVVDKVGNSTSWTFIMVVRTFGKYKDCWCTHRVMPSDSKWLAEV
eukprot:scaffold5952_cov50-Prasinocladus_malaysianus.AAC.1